MPELREIGLDPAVQGVPVKKKLSVTPIKMELVGGVTYLTVQHNRYRCIKTTKASSCVPVRDMSPRHGIISAATMR